MKPRWLHIVLFLLLGNALPAQTVLTGTVKDTEGETLPNIKVLAYKAGSRVIVAYAGTDNDGRYSLSVNAEADSLDVATSSLFSTSRPNASPTAARRWISRFAKRCRN